MNPRLAIVIPTRNRQSYCDQAVRQVLGACSLDCEVVVYDNSDTRELEKLLADLSDSRLKYFYDSDTLSFVDNFSRAVGAAKADYVCVIGDDDGVLPTLCGAVDIMRDKGIDALVPSINVAYFWPSEHPIIPGGGEGYLNLAFLKYSTRVLSPEQGLADLMRNAAQNYQSLDIPRLYHGIVSRSCLEAVIRRTGHLFGGLTPDMYISVALSNVCKKVVRIDVPLTISGISPKSGSAQSATGEHTGELSMAPHFKGHGDYVWSEKVPRFYSVQTIWADTALHALSEFGRQDLVDAFNVARMAAIARCDYRRFDAITKAYIIEHRVGALRLALECAGYLNGKYVKRLLKRLVRRKGEVLKFYHVPDIAGAERIILQHVDQGRTLDALGRVSA